VNWLTGLGTGAGIGIAFYGGLWLSVQHVSAAPHRTSWLGASRAVRFALVGLGFYGLSREGLDLALMGLAGLLLVRHHLLQRLGGLSRA
jgi:F1F0 ATPase subunit 2